MYSIPRGFVPLYRILVAIVALEGVALPPFRGFLRACAAFSKAPTQMTPLGLQRSCIRFPGGAVESGHWWGRGHGTDCCQQKQATRKGEKVMCCT